MKNLENTKWMQVRQFYINKAKMFLLGAVVDPKTYLLQEPLVHWFVGVP